MSICAQIETKCKYMLLVLEITQCLNIIFKIVNGEIDDFCLGRRRQDINKFKDKEGKHRSC